MHTSKYLFKNQYQSCELPHSMTVNYIGAINSSLQGQAPKASLDVSTILFTVYGCVSLK